MDTPSQQNLNQLAIGTVLGDFKITGIVGEGGFGIVYLAYEATLDRTVAIKEYLPSSIAGRTGSQSVQVRSQLNTNAFSTGLKNFLREAQLLARFSHPAMVEVHRVWEQNSTAYMAMRYYDGKTLRELRQADGKFDALYIRRLVEPIFDALTLLHAQNVIHRDVSPDNILMRGNGAPVLLDLGAARLVIGGMTQALTTILKPGYAPIEQYVDDGTMRQGPWTDVYGLGAVLYYLLTGAAPPQAVARMITDPLRNTLASSAKIPVAPYFMDALVNALAVRPEDRYQSVDELRDGLQWNEPLPIEPRTTYVRADASKIANATGASLAGVTVAGAAASKVATQTSIHAAAIKPTVSAPQVSQPLDRVFAQDSDATVVWQSAPGAGHPVTGSKAKPLVAPAPPPPPPAPLSAAVRAKSYGEASASAPSDAPDDSGASGSKMWIYATVAALLAAGAGYFALNRGDKTSPPPSPAVLASTDPAPVAPPVVAAPAAAPPPPAPVAPPVVAAPAPPPARPAVNPAETAAKTTAETKAKEAAREELEAITAAKAEKAKRDAEDKAKAKSEALEKSAKAKTDADERTKARAKQDAEERAAAASRADLEERARNKARAEEEERQAAAKARADAEKSAKSASPSGGLVVTPPRRTVEELSAAGKAAFGRGEIASARAAWNELVNHPDAQARSKAITYNNLAVSYCKFGDEASCERMYLAMFRADRNYDAEERENPTFKKAYDRASRTAKALR